MSAGLRRFSKPLAHLRGAPAGAMICSCKCIQTPTSTTKRTCFSSRRSAVVCAAEPSKTEDDSESRLAELESRARKGKGPQVRSPPFGEPKLDVAQVVWKEGEVLPEGWDKMDPVEKATQLYMGERGFLFWINEAAFASVFIIAGLWIVFRFIGPALGLYELSNGPAQ